MWSRQNLDLHHPQISARGRAGPCAPSPLSHPHIIWDSPRGIDGSATNVLRFHSVKTYPCSKVRDADTPGPCPFPSPSTPAPGKHARASSNCHTDTMLPPQRSSLMIHVSPREERQEGHSTRTDHFLQIRASSTSGSCCGL